MRLQEIQGVRQICGNSWEAWGEQANNIIWDKRYQNFEEVPKGKKVLLSKKLLKNNEVNMWGEWKWVQIVSWSIIDMNVILKLWKFLFKIQEKMLQINLLK